ncbi:MAG: efflux RND transporter permease subunit, partial [Candidatus Hydrogenedentota bacterium]
LALVIPTPTGEQMRLEELALVQMGEKELENVVRLNGREAVELEIFKEGDANTVEVCNQLKDFFGFERPKNVLMDMISMAAERVSSERAKKMMEEKKRQEEVRDQLRSRLPSYIEKAIVTDQSHFIKASIAEVRDSAVVGAILSLFVLFLFLQELRSTLIIAVATPISIMATFIPMYMGHVSLNIMSLGGLALGIGMLVDNSIVVLESIFRCREEGDSLLDAAERGTREVAAAVTSSTLTTIAVFAPIVFVEGIAGQLFRDLALTVTYSLTASLIVALYLVPMMVSRQARPLASQDQAVWLVKAYLEARQERGASRMQALMGIPSSGLRYTRDWLRAAWKETVGATLAAARGGAASWPARTTATVGVPVVVGLFVIQVALKLVAAVLITIFFFGTTMFFSMLWVLGRVLGLILAVPARLFDQGFRVFRELYGVALRFSLNYSPLVLCIVMAVAAHSAWLGRNLGRELIPPMKQGDFGIRVEAPPGTRLEDTETRAGLIETIVRESPYVDTVTVQVGGEGRNSESSSGENIAEFTVKLRDPDTTIPMQDEIIEDIRQHVIAATPDQVTFTLPTMFSFKTAVELEIYGEGLDELRELGVTALAALEGVQGLKDVELSLKKGHPEIIITPDRDLLAAKGLGPDAIARLLRTEVGGDIATRFSRGGDKIDIRVRTDNQRLKSKQDLENLSVTETGPPTPLSSVATISTKPGPSEIRRINQRQVVVISANVEGRDLGRVAADMQARLDQIYWPQGYYYLMGGQQEELQRSYQGLMFALVLSLFLVYVIMACQFESLTHPALIMFTVPLGLIGVVYALNYTGIDISVTVLIGAIVLGGIVVDAATIMVDYINQLRERGLDKIDAVVEGCKIRLRPIMMTTLTSVLGLIPMAFSTGEGAEMRRPMAVTVMAGLSSSTLLTLFVIPMFYHLFGGRDRKRAVK